MKTIRQQLVVSIFVAVTLVGLSVEGDEFTDLLARYDIEPTRDSFERYLASLHATPDIRREYAGFIDQLGDERFEIREAAMVRLMRTPIYVREMLEEATQSNDREIGYRAKLVLEHAEQNYSTILHAVFRTISKQEIKGLVRPVLETMPLCVRKHVIAAGHRALATTVENDTDLEIVLESIRADKSEMQIAAIHVAAGAAYEKSVGALVELLVDEDPRVKFAAAYALADHGDRRSLTSLVDLLTAEDLAIRVESVQALRGLTGQRFRYVAYAEAVERDKALKSWRDWLTTNGATAKLTFPLKRVHVELGRTLICLATQGKVIELDATGRQVWEQTGLKYPWRASGLLNGHRLVACYNGRCVREYDARGKEVWKSESLPGGPHSVQRLETGNTLMGCSDSNQVIEVNTDGKKVWGVTIVGRPVDARRLPNGNTLVAFQRAGKVAEINQAGKEVWKIDGLKGPNTVQPLDNGNFLIAEINSKRVAEHTADGKVVWSINPKTAPYDAQRLADGTTIVAEQGRITVYSGDGKEVSTRTTNGDTRVTRY